MRNRFDAQLEHLHVELIKMGALCEESIAAAMRFLLENEKDMGTRAMAAEREVDQKERDIETLCMKLLLHQQPVARDLRTISSALKMISDMERIGDQAADIAEIARDIESRELCGQVPIAEMAKAAVEMVTDSVDAFVRGDESLAHAVIVGDDRVDDLFLQMRAKLIQLISAGENGSVCLDLMMVAKYFERIGDHSVNVAQWVEYSLTGHYEQG